MKKVRIQPGCTTCGLCEFLAPAVFQVTDISHVRPAAPIDAHKEAVDRAIAECPVQVITYQDEDLHDDEIS